MARRRGGANRARAARGRDEVGTTQSRSQASVAGHCGRLAATEGRDASGHWFCEDRRKVQCNFSRFFFQTRGYEGTHEESDQSLSPREPLSLRSGASERLCLISRRGRTQKKRIIQIQASADPLPRRFNPLFVAASPTVQTTSSIPALISTSGSPSFCVPLRRSRDRGIGRFLDTGWCSPAAGAYP